jgi:hypothetical protein
MRLGFRRGAAAAACGLAVVALVACGAESGGGAGGADLAADRGDAAVADSGGAVDVAANVDGGAAAAPQRVSVHEARAWMLSAAHDTLLVCAYAGAGACDGQLLEGAITLTALEERAAAGDLPLDRRIVFYCS